MHRNKSSETQQR